MTSALQAGHITHLIKALRLMVVLYLVALAIRSILLPQVGVFPKAPTLFAVALLISGAVFLPWHRWILTVRGLVSLSVLMALAISMAASRASWQTGTVGWWLLPLVVGSWSVALVSLEQKEPAANAWHLSRSQIALALAFLAFLAVNWWLARTGPAAGSTRVNEMLRIVALELAVVMCSAVCLKAYLHGVPWQQVRDAVAWAVALVISLFLSFVVLFYDLIAEQASPMPPQEFYVGAWLAVALVLALSAWQWSRWRLATWVFSAFIIWTLFYAATHGVLATVSLPLVAIAWLFILPHQQWPLAALGSMTYVLRLLTLEGMDSAPLTLYLICGAAVFVWMVWLTKGLSLQGKRLEPTSLAAEGLIVLNARQRVLIAGVFGVALLIPGAVFLLEQHPSPGLYQAMIITSVVAMLAFYMMGRHILGNEALKRHSQAFAQQTEILNNVNVALEVFGADGQLRWCNPAARQMFGLRADEAPNVSLFDDEWFRRSGQDRAAKQVLESGQAQTLEEQVSTEQGDVRDFRYRISRINISGIEQILVQTEDLTQVQQLRQRAEAESRERASKAEALLALQAEQAQILATASVGLGCVKAGRFVWVNAFFAQMMGYAAEDLEGLRVAEIFSDASEFSDFRERVLQPWPADLAHRRMEIRILDKAGIVRLHEIVISRTPGRDNEAVFAARDISEERVRAIALEQSLAQEQAVRQALDALRTEQQTILDSAVFGLAHARNRRWVWVNQEFARMLGYEVKELIGRPTRLVYFDELAFKQATTLALRQAEAGRDAIEMELHFVHKDGTPRLISIRGRMFDAEHFDVIFSYRDVTEERAAERAMADALEAAKAGERAKDEFLSVISHEVRTPLNSVMGLLQVAQLEKDLAPSTRELLDSMSQSSEMLLSVLNDVLDASAMSSGKLHVHAREVSQALLIDSVRQLSNGLTVPDGVQLHLALPEKTDQRLLLDDLRVKQIILNLLSNALKFTPQGSVTLSMVLQRTGPRAQQLLITVQDTGIGMDPQAQQRVFEPFTQADMSTRRRYGGTGLGLTIVQGLVEKMNGSISLKSAPGVGSTFVVAIPVTKVGTEGQSAPTEVEARPSSSEAPAALRLVTAAVNVTGNDDPAQGAAQPVGTGELAGVHVLVVEDEPSNRRVHQALLQGAGAQVSLARSGQEALGLLRRDGAAVDLVLLDLQMPGMDGFEVARAIRALASPRADVPIVALSGNVLNREPERVRAVGMNGFLSKPVLRASLLDEIRRALSQASA